MGWWISWAEARDTGGREAQVTGTAGIVVIGGVNADLSVEADALPSPGETVLGGDLVRSSGGKGANQAVALARLGAQVRLIGRVGDDADGAFCAALTHRLVLGVDLVAAAGYAVAVGGLAVLGMGARTSLPDTDSAAALLRSRASCRRRRGRSRPW